ATPPIATLCLHDALPISRPSPSSCEPNSPVGKSKSSPLNPPTTSRLTMPTCGAWLIRSKLAAHPAPLLAHRNIREAVRLDPKFALSWALLSYVEARGYRTLTLQPTVTLREEARQAAETALTLQPNLGEAVWAKGYYHYACLNDYDTAVRYLEEARQLLPNSSRIPESLAYVTRRRGQWYRSESYL